MAMSKLMSAASRLSSLHWVSVPDRAGRVPGLQRGRRPGGRTVHAYPTPRVGGVSIAVAYAAAVLAFFGPKGQLPDYYSEALKLLPGALVIFRHGIAGRFP